MSELFTNFQNFINNLPLNVPGSSIEALLQQMAPESSRLFKLCAIPHYINPAILQILEPRINESQANNYYTEFSNLSFTHYKDEGLTIQDESRRYLFDRWLEPDNSQEFHQASSRLIDYFEQLISDTSDELSHIFNMQLMFHQIGTDQSNGFSEFESLWVQEHLYFRLDNCESLIGLVREYDSILSPEIEVRLSYYEGVLSSDLFMFDKAKEQFQNVMISHHADTNLKVNTLMRLGRLYNAEHSWSDAINNFEKALMISSDMKSQDNMPSMLHDLATAYRKTSDFEKAESLLNEGIQIALQKQSQSETALCYNGLGNLYLKKGDILKAIEYYEKSLEYQNQSGDRFKAAYIYNNLGKAYFDLRKWDESERYYNESLNIKRDAGDSLGQAKSLNNLMPVYLQQNKTDLAIKCAMEAFELFEGLNDFHNAALIKRNMGKLYCNVNDIEKALKSYGEAVELYERCKSKEQADAVRQEITRIASCNSTRYPWWAWASVIIALMVVTIIILVIIYDN